MTQQYAVGDKVRILGLSIFDADEIGKTGVITDGNRELCIGGFGAVVKLPNGRKRVYEYKNIEKVAEHMTKKFNVGDTVRVVAEHFHYNIGDTFVIAKIDEEGDLFNRGSICVNPRKVELVNAKPTQSTPKKKARISALEAQVAELTAKVEALEKAQKPTVKLADTAEVFIDGKSFGKVTAVEARVLSANEQRKAIIAEAKAFVEDAKNRTGRITNRKGYHYPAKGVHYIADADFIVNAKKRTVVAILRNQVGAKEITAKAIAKCAPDDVFNADIGKAIALGRALGLDVKRFEQAVKPTEVVVGQTFKVTSRGAITGKVAQITRMHPSCDGVYGKAFKHTNDGGWLGAEQVTIIDDTDAQY